MALAKSVKVSSKNLTKEERAIREDTEEKLKGGEGKIIAPSYLSKEQKRIFKRIVDILKPSGMLGSIDIYLLAQTSVAINRLQAIEQLINEDISNLKDKDIMRAKSEYTKEFYRCCNELSLSPQSRAKLGVLVVQQKQNQEDALLKVLAGGDKK